MAPLTILYQDEHLVAIDKPAGMVGHRGRWVLPGILVRSFLFMKR